MSQFFQTTPGDLIADGLYKALALALYPGSFWPVSVALVAKALGATRGTRRDGFTTISGMRDGTGAGHDEEDPPRERGKAQAQQGKGDPRGSELGKAQVQHGGGRSLIRGNTPGDLMKSARL